MDEVLRVIEGSEEPLTAAEIADQTEYSERSVQGWLSALEKRNKIVRVKGADILGHGQEPDRWRRAGPFTGLLAQD